MKRDIESVVLKHLTYRRNQNWAPEPDYANKALLDRKQSDACIPGRHVTFLAFCIVILFWGRFLALLQLSLGDNRYSHLAFVPFISAGLLYLEHKNLLWSFDYRRKLGIALLACAVLLRFVAMRWAGPSTALPLSIVALVLAWIAAFVLCYGTQALRVARFPFLFLLLMVLCSP
jgi:hypothetical protein